MSNSPRTPLRSPHRSSAAPLPHGSPHSPLVLPPSYPQAHHPYTNPPASHGHPTGELHYQHHHHHHHHHHPATHRAPLHPHSVPAHGYAQQYPPTYTHQQQQGYLSALAGNPQQQSSYQHPNSRYAPAAAGATGTRLPQNNPGRDGGIIGGLKRRIEGQRRRGETPSGRRGNIPLASSMIKLAAAGTAAIGSIGAAVVSSLENCESDDHGGGIDGGDYAEDGDFGDIGGDF